MSSYQSADIRNIALVGHSAAGKTTLAEALLEKTGAIHTRGTVERGSTVCDFDPHEKELGHSLETAVCSMEHQGIHINLIDTPGYPDFAGRSIAVLPAVETAAVVINAEHGIELVTRRMMEAAAKDGLCRMIIINHIDAPGINLQQLMNDIREAFGNECLPINLPADGAKKVVDCYFKPDNEVAVDFSSVEAAHTEIIDQVVELDEELMEVYLEQGQDMNPSQLHDVFEKAMRRGHLVPVCFVSAETGSGINQLLNVFVQLMPNPMEGNPPPFIKGEGDDTEAVKVEPDADKHVIAHVFKVMVDPFIGRMGIFRIHQGSITPNTQLFIGDARKPFKVSHLYRLQGKEHVEMARGIPGDICAVAKVDEIEFDSVLHDSHEEDRFHLEAVTSPPPMHGVAITPKRRGDEQKLSEALAKLSAEDPSLVVEHHASANETVLRGSGELHLRAIMERMKERFHVEVDTRPPSIPYRETITRKAEGHHRHKKQTGGAGQFGEVFLRIEPLPRDQGFEFVNKVVGGSIPYQFIPAVEKGVRQVLTSGAIAGYAMQDIRVTVYDGKHHPVDSKEVAFVAAGKKAFVAAIKQARPIILEPIVKVEITVPGDHMGDIAGDLSSRRGRINGNEVLSGNQVRIDGEVPLAELENYQTRLGSLTGGVGSFTMAFSHYQPVPAPLQKEMSTSFQVADSA